MSELQEQIKEPALEDQNSEVSKDFNTEVGEEIFSSKKKILSLALGELPLASFLFGYQNPGKLTDDLIKIRAANDSDYSRKAA